MEFYPLMVKAHGGFAMLLTLIALVGLALSIKAAATGSAGNLKPANIVGLIETILAGLVNLTGLVVLVMASALMTQLWPWLALVIMVAYAIFMKRVTKPARAAAASAPAKWAAMQAVQVLMIFVAYGLMIAKPF